jgi:gamma-glutamyl-gamma-aminobutyraldehyde dehydrogenase
MAPRDRMAVLYRYASLIEEKAEQLAVLDTLDMGKPISDMVGVDIPAVVETILFMAEYIDKMEGSVTNTESEVMHFVLREPIGVVAALSPWNYPLLMAIWKVAPALAAGNCVVLKPAEQAPLSCLKLAELFVEAGVIWVNCFDEGDMTQPFGGYKQSGHARDKCIESLLGHTQSKSAWLRLSA